MGAYHQMGHDSQNLLGAIAGYRGAVVSPVNEVESDLQAIIAKHSSPTFEFVFDPQLYYPRRVDRGKLSTWSYFPSDLDTADLSSNAWWDGVLTELAATAQRVGALAVCAPAIVPAMYTNEYYDRMRVNGDQLVDLVPSGSRVLQTVLARLEDLATKNRALEIASVVSNTKVSGVYLMFMSDVKPRDELREVEELKGAMRLIRLLENAGLPVLVGCSSSDVVLWKAAGASSCATGKFANLRRFSKTRFDESEDGGSQKAYWFEEALLAFIRESDLTRVQAHGIAGSTTNPFGTQILSQLVSEPGKAWVALGWRQYMHWFADIESRLQAGTAVPRDLVRAAEANWKSLEDNDVFMEEQANDGTWLRAWLRAIVEFSK